jgi:uncharacterized protein (DUF4415 family)
MPKLKPDHISPTPEEVAAINAAAKSDPDTIYFDTDEEYDSFFAQAEAYKTYMARSPKVAISIRLDQVVLDYFKAGGSGWQGRINAALRRIAETDPVSVHEPDAPAFNHKK